MASTAQIHRFRDKVAVYVGDGTFKTVQIELEDKAP